MINHWSMFSHGEQFAWACMVCGLRSICIWREFHSLKEKSGAETAPGWGRFHVHRMAPI